MEEEQFLKKYPNYAILRFLTRKISIGLGILIQFVVMVEFLIGTIIIYRENKLSLE